MKVHLNVAHRANGSSFGSVEETGATLEKIADIGLPVSVGLGEDVRTVSGMLVTIDRLPVDFVDADCQHLPANAAKLTSSSTSGTDLSLARHTADH